MRKLISVLLILSMLVCMIPAVSITSFAEGAAITPDQSWYNASETNYYIYDAADLLGLGAMLAYHDGSSPVYNNAFLGKTIHIMNDIDLNPGWDAFGGTKPTNVWPVMPNSRDFAGTIDGHGHTISGVYQVNGATKAGMFGPIKGDSVTVKDLAIKNSYSQNNNADGHGMLFGTMEENATVTFSNIYVDAIIVNTDTNGGDYGVGGIIGGVMSTSDTTDSFSMTNCVFDGTIRVSPSQSGATTYVGGLIGRYNELGTFTINNCASYGTLEATASNGAIVMMGGIMGYNSATSHSITIEDCISCPTLSKTIADGDTTSEIICGSIVGAARYNSTTVFAKTKYENNICVTANISYSGRQRVLGCGYTQKHTKPSIFCDSADYYANSIVNNSHGAESSAITGEAATAYLSGKGYTGWTATETYPLPTTVVNMLTTHVTEVIGYQAMEAEGGKFNFRIVGVFNLEEGKTLKDYELVGFEASATYGGSTQDKTYTSNTVYTSISGDDTTGLVEYRASDFGGDYFFVMPCLDFPEPAAGTSVVVKIKSFYKLAGDESTTTSETDWVTINVAPPKDHVN